MKVGTIKPEWKEAAARYAGRVVPTICWNDKSPGSTKFERQSYSGTLAEFFVADILRGEGYEVTGPDVQIYDASRKKFGPDLLARRGSQTWIEISVKHQRLAWTRISKGFSWTIQRAIDQPKPRVDYCIQKNHWMHFCMANDDATAFCIVGRAYGNHLIRDDGSIVWVEPVVLAYRGKQKAFNLSDLRLHQPTMFPNSEEDCYKALFAIQDQSDGSLLEYSTSSGTLSPIVNPSSEARPSPSPSPRNFQKRGSQYTTPILGSPNSGLPWWM